MLTTTAASIVCDIMRFRRGDWNGDGACNLTDAVALLDHLFRGGPGAACAKAGDADDSGQLEITDALRIIFHLFQGGMAHREPFGVCGEDPTPDLLPCARFQPCH